MAYKLNEKGVSNAEKLIKAGKVDKDSSWSFSAEDGNAILGDNDWAEYSKWFLAVDPEATDETKAKYHYPYGKNGKVYRSGVIAVKQRAAQQGEDDVEKAASDLLDEIDKDKGKKNLNILYRSAQVGPIDEANKQVTLSFSSEEPVFRFFGNEILSHDRNAANISPLLQVGAVLRNHDPDQIVAKPVDAFIDPVAKKGRAVIQFVDTPASKQAWEEVQAGLLRGVSVGYSIDDYEELSDDDPQFPGIRATKWNVHEISLTPIPADPTVGVGRSKTIQKEDTYVEEQNVIELKKAAEKAERERVIAIRELCKAHKIDEAKMNKFIDDGINLDQARAAILDELEAKQKVVGAAPKVTMGASDAEQWRDMVANGIYAKVNKSIAKDMPRESLRYSQMSLIDIAKEALQRIGQSVEGSKLDIAKRALIGTTSDFPGLMLNVANKTLLTAYEQFPTTYQLWTRTVPASDFKPMTRVKFGSFPTLPIVEQGADFQFAKINDSYTQYAIGKYGEIFSLTRETIINDDLAAFTQIPMRFGQAAKRTIDATVYKLINSNPSITSTIVVNGVPQQVTANVFSTTFGTLGTAGLISLTTLDEAHKLFMAQTDISGNPISVTPKYLLVPPAIRSTANSWMRSTFVPGVYNEVNTYANYAEIIESPFLASAQGGSDLAWYLLGDPSIVDTVEVAFLDGREAPVVEMNPSFANDGVAFKVRLDFGTAIIDHRGLFMNAG